MNVTKAKNRTKKFTEQIHEKLMDLCNLIRPSSSLSNMNSNKRLKPPPIRVRTQKLNANPMGTSLNGPEQDYKGKSVLNNISFKGDTNQPFKENTQKPKKTPKERKPRVPKKGTSLDGPEKDYKGKLSDLYEVDHDDGETYYIDIHTDKVYTADKKYHGRLDEQNYRYDSLLHEPRHRRTYLKGIRNIMRE